tara:strand:+ start:295 stop:489 length:195 start_codon:yes stop_codon:yes gene_type:complete
MLKVDGLQEPQHLICAQENQLLDDYLVHCAGKDYLDLNPAGKQKLLDYIPTIVQWRMGNVTTRS